MVTERNQSSNTEPDDIGLAIAEFVKRAEARNPGMSVEEAWKLEEEERNEAGRRKRFEEAMAEIPEQYRGPIELLPPVRQWLEEFCYGGLSETDKPSLAFFGRTGCGKTHHAYEILKTAIGIGSYDFRFFTSLEMCKAVQAGYRDQSSARVTPAKLVDVDLLVIDDIGVHQMTDDRHEILMEVIDGRYKHRRPTIFSTNVAAKRISLPIAEGGAGLGDRMASRLNGMCRPVVFPAIDFRSGIDYREGAE